VEADVLNRNRPRALVVDDVADTADSMAMLLGLWGYRTKVCYGGVAALEAARSYRPQVVLLDVGMPGTDGFQVALGLRAMPGLECTVVLGISGHTGAACRDLGVAAGFDQYLIKPVDPVYLQGLLARAVPLGRWSGSIVRLREGLGGSSLQENKAMSRVPILARGEIPCDRAVR
jgi:CheY-like chemotaxis protein